MAHRRHESPRLRWEPANVGLELQSGVHGGCPAGCLSHPKQVRRLVPTVAGVFSLVLDRD